MFDFDWNSEETKTFDVFSQPDLKQFLYEWINMTIQLVCICFNHLDSLVAIKRIIQPCNVLKRGNKRTFPKLWSNILICSFINSIIYWNSWILKHFWNMVRKREDNLTSSLAFEYWNSLVCIIMNIILYYHCCGYAWIDLRH